ncbi:sporulation protein YlmC with PRC-barrel domain [Devosia sp. UYZn731]|uniref:PRC-barrel domain-containing protein n=1 Tax=Devosia sp. UYZn731 TaxID=3156345 RepID=UPI0033991125
MRHALLALPAFVLLLAAPALAQQAAPPAAAPSELEQSGLTPPTILSEGYSTHGQDTLVTRLLGQKVYSSVADDAKEIGTISDMVVTSGQGISAVVIGVGGFLGIGTKDVAIDFAQLEWAERQDGSRRWVLDTTAEELTAAPAFIWTDSEEAKGPAMTPEQEQEQMAPGDPNAAPADPDETTDQPDRPVISIPVDRTGLTDFDGSTLTADELRGTGVYGIDDEPIGSISDVVLTPQGGIDALVVDVGGFLGLGAKPVAVGFDKLSFSADTSGTRYLFINASRGQLEAQVPYDPATYAADRANQRMVITP